MTKYLPILILIITTFSSCGPTIYFPEKVNAPAFAHKGEAKAIAGFKLQGLGYNSSNVLAPQFDAAYALTNHFGILGSYRSLANKWLDENGILANSASIIDFSGYYNSHYFEGGTGYFTTMGKVGRFEAYGGVGTGKMSRSGFYSHQYDFSSNYYKIFLQPALHIAPNNGKVFIVGIGTRFTTVKYYNFNATDPDTRYIVMGYNPSATYKTGVNDKTLIMFEPFINMEAGYKFMKFNLQLSYEKGISNGTGYLGMSPALTFGLVFHYAKEYFR